MLKQNNRGDTIIEVILAFAVFSFIAVGVSILMDKGIGLAQRSLEITLVREQIDAQADLIRYAQDIQNPGAGTLWKDSIIANKVTDPASNKADGGCPTTPPLGSFIMYATPTDVRYIKLDGTNFAKADVYSRVFQAGEPGFTKAYGMWVQAVEVGGTPRAYDMHVQACWDSPGSNLPVTIGTIVRLYAPQI